MGRAADRGWLAGLGPRRPSSAVRAQARRWPSSAVGAQARRWPSSAVGAQARRWPSSPGGARRRGGPPPAGGPPAPPRGERAMTLIEVLITVALIAVVTGAAVMGFGVREQAKLRRSAVLIAGAVRIAYGHANATSKTVRLVFDFDGRTVMLEESSSPLLLVKGEKTGGAAAATEAEREAIEAGESLLKGPQPPRPTFEPTRAFGWTPEEGQPGKALESGIRFLAVETAHNEEAEDSGRAYLYFWPGGQTERAAIQLVKGSSEGDEHPDEDVMTVVVSPLTGKTVIKKGKVAMPRPRTDAEESDREEESP